MTSARARPSAGIPHEHLAALSHEFRTPLNGVIGMARLLEGTRLTAEQRAYVAALTESGEHLLGLVNDVLDYAKLGAGRVELNPAPVAPEDLLRSVCELLSPRAHEKGLEIGWAADAGLAADPRRRGAAEADPAQSSPATRSSSSTPAACCCWPSGRRRRSPALHRLRHRPRRARGGAGQHLRGLRPGRPRAGRAAGRRGPGPGHRQPPGRGHGRASWASTAAEGRGADFWFEAAFAPAGPRRRRARPWPGARVAVASPSAIVREAAARQIEACGGARRAAPSAWTRR